MAVQLLGYPLRDTNNVDTKSEGVPIEIQCSRSQWYFSRQELDYYSPSRKDGIEVEQESELRRLYCSFIQELGMELKVPQVTIATSMMLCHRFYMRQSHAKNDWQTIAIVCVFLACKAEETPIWLSDITIVAYKLMYKWDPSAPRRIKQKDVYEKQKELLLTGERMLLSTIAFDLNIELPYKPLVAALKRLNISNKELSKVAWNFVNDWMRTMLCLQYKPHYIAAGSVFLAAKFQQVKLPVDMGRVWWMQFDVAPRQLEEVIQEMLRYLDKKPKQVTPLVPAKAVKSETVVSKSAPNITPQPITKCSSNVSWQTLEKSESTQSCVLNGSNVDTKPRVGDGKFNKSVVSNCSDCGSTSSTVENGDGEPKPRGSNPIVEVCNSKIDVNKIREAMKRRRQDKDVNKKIVEAADDEIDSEAWIEMELENGIELDTVTANKKIKV